MNPKHIIRKLESSLANDNGKKRRQIPCPKNSDIVHLTDAQVGYQYVELPEDTSWIEAMACNENYKKGISYYPVQRRRPDGSLVTHIYEIEDASTLRHVAGPLTMMDGSVDMTIFGAALSSQGLLVLCVMNKNALICFDLEQLEEDDNGTTTCHFQVDQIPNANDVCFDPRNESIMYSVGGETRHWLPGIKYNDSAFGTAYQTTLSRRQKNDSDKSYEYSHDTQQIARGMTTLAGVKCLRNRIYLSQLYSVLAFEQSDPTSALECV